MSPRIIHIPLSGGDRKAQAKGIRYTHGIHESAYRESVLIRSAAEAKIRDADRLECEAWNAIMWAGGPAMPSPGRSPSGANAINGGYDLLDAKCKRPVRTRSRHICMHPPGSAPADYLEGAGSRNRNLRECRPIVAVIVRICLRIQSLESASVMR
jgi:hypothetical protein